MYLLFVVGMFALALVLLRYAKKPVAAAAFLLAAVSMLVATDQAEARQRRLFNGRLRGAVSRAAEVPRNVVRGTANVVRGTARAATQPLRSVPGDCPNCRRSFEVESVAGCDNPNCDCEDCNCVDCECGTKVKAGKQPAPDSSFDDSMDVSHGEQAMVNAINRYRANHGKPAMVIDRVLMRMARQRCAAFDHYQPRFGGWIHQQAHRHGYIATDNIAKDYATGVEAVGDDSSGWGSRHGVGHDRQMLGLIKVNGTWQDERFDRVGVASVGRKYIAVFGRRT